MEELSCLINNQLKLLKEAVRKRGRVNILIAGKTGVGKSTLINAIFQGNFATTGQGKPVTKSTREIKKSGVPLRIFDTRGLELDRVGRSIEELEELITRLGRAQDRNKHIHCGWLCISEDSRRVEDGEIRLLRMLARHFPVIVIITKARSDDGFLAKVRQLLPEAGNVLRVRAIAERQDDGHVLRPVNLPEVVEWTMRAIPNRHRNAFAAAQKVALNLKRERARLVVASAATAAAAVGAAPIPFADAYLLVPIQVSMLASITVAFGLPVNAGFLATLLSATFSGIGGTLVGRSLVQNMLLLIPGAGVLLHGMIAGATAAIFTTAFGEAHITALTCFLKANPERVPTGSEIATTLKEELWRRDPFAPVNRNNAVASAGNSFPERSPRGMRATARRQRVVRFSSSKLLTRLTNASSN